MLGILLTASVCLVVVHPVISLEEQCQQDGPCRCQFENGGEIDLSKLGLQNGSALISDLPQGDYLYSFNPCFPFSEGNDPAGCINVAGCQVDPASGAHYIIGDVTGAVLKYDEQKLVGQYTHEDEFGKLRLSTVDYICDPQATTPNVSTEGELGMREYKFTIISKSACPSGGPTPTPSPSPTPTPSHKPRCTTDYEDFIKTCYYGYDGHPEPVKLLIIHEWNGQCDFPTNLDVAIHLYSDKSTCQGVNNRCHPNQPFSVNDDVCKEP